MSVTLHQIPVTRGRPRRARRVLLFLLLLIVTDDAVDLLNAVLIEKGYTAIRNGRILKIVNRRDAQRRDLPVETGSVILLSGGGDGAS